MLSNWVLGPLKPILHPKEVQIWRIILPVPEAVKQEFQKGLSESELVRLKKFHFKGDQERFLVARGGLRDILSRYLNILPGDINFNYTKFGKPYLQDRHLQFNVSHSADCILYAISVHNQLGIDVEQIKSDIDFLSVAKTICSENEYEKLLDFPKEEQCLAFYRCWTRKESIIKMIGKGLFFPVNQLEVGFSLIKKINLLNGRVRCSLEEIDPAVHYTAAVAVEHEYNEIFLWDWRGNNGL